MGGSFDRLNKFELEEGAAFKPRFDPDGLIPAIITDAGAAVS